MKRTGVETGTGNTKTIRTGKNRAVKRLMTLVGMTLLLSLCWGQMVFATSYVENFATGIFFDNLKWIANIAIVAVCFLNGIKRNYTSVLITLVIGGIVLFFIANPTKLQDIGNTIGGTIFK